MCVSYFAWLHPQLPELLLLLLFNRDEVLHRPTEPSHWWDDAPHILGGRDEVAGGTWMAISTTGRAAFLTNFRELRDSARLGAPSRGALPVDFVTGQAAPEEYLAGLDAKAYPGFNLMAADLCQRRMAYLCNKRPETGPQEVAPGLHGITNGYMDAHWPKVDEGVQRLQQLLDSGAFDGGGDAASNVGSASSEEYNGASSNGSGGGAEGGSGGNSSGGGAEGGSGGNGCGAAVPWRRLFGLLSDDRRLEERPERLPDTGYGHEFEAAVSGVFVQPVDTQWGPFGTRSQTVVAVWADGRSELRERYIAKDGSWQELQHCFEVAVLQAEAAAGEGGCAAAAQRGGGAP